MPTMGETFQTFDRARDAALTETQMTPGDGASLKIRRYEAAFSGLVREIASTFEQMKAENAQLRAGMAEMQARAANAEERAARALADLQASDARCADLRDRLGHLEGALEAAEAHIQESTDHIARLGSLILHSRAGNDDQPAKPQAPAQPPATEGITARQVDAILRRRAAG